MTNQEIFQARCKRINKSSSRKNIVKTRSTRRMGERLIMPLMFFCCIGGGLTATWDFMDRPTDTPFALAEDLTEQLISYLTTI